MYRDFFEEISGSYPIALPSSTTAVFSKRTPCIQRNKLGLTE